MFNFGLCGIPLGLATICKLMAFRIDDFPKMATHLSAYAMVANSTIMVHIGPSVYYSKQLVIIFVIYIRIFHYI